MPVEPEDKPATTAEKIDAGIITADDRKVLQDIYQKSHDGEFTNDEVLQLVASYNENKITNPKVLTILQRYEVDGEGKIEHLELENLRHHMSISDTTARYAGYTSAFARAFRYVAFTSDFGEALRPVVSPRVVTGTFAITLGYCVADVGYEAYKLKENNYITEKNEHMSMTQCIVERATFQAVASVGIPFDLIHQTVNVAHKFFNKINRFKRWGPSLVGLAVLPLLPMYLDEPVEHAVEYVFHRFGPWAKKTPASTTTATEATHVKKE